MKCVERGLTLLEFPKMTLGMPKFTMPPIVETLLAVQFDPLIKMRITDYGLFWSKIRDAFPIVQEHPPVPSVIEASPAQPMVINPLQWRIGGGFPLPRVWFKGAPSAEAATGDRGIQLQTDRFMQNWMRSEPGKGQYPSYEANRTEFLKYFQIFSDFVEERELGPLTPNQCEVTYVNRITIEDGDLNKTFRACFPSLAVRHSTDFLPGSDSTGYMASFPIAGNYGRMHVMINGPVKLDAGDVVIDFRLTARGAPRGAAGGQIVNWLDLGREWVVRGFHCLTSEEMHRKWGYKHE
jgi:uncharacterized protein (TIGR04255 family)